MKKNIIVFLIIFFILSTFICYINAALAQDAKKSFESGLQNTGKNSGYINTVDEGKLDKADSMVYSKVGLIISGFLGLLGIIFVILMIYGGYVWMTAHGDEQRVTKAKETIKEAAIGLIIVIAAYAITAFVGQIITKSSPSKESLDIPQGGSDGYGGIQI